MSNCCCCELPPEEKAFIRPIAECQCEEVVVTCNPEIVTIATPALDYVEEETETVVFDKWKKEQAKIEPVSGDFQAKLFAALHPNVAVADTTGRDLQATGGWTNRSIAKTHEEIQAEFIAKQAENPAKFSEDENTLGQDVGAAARNPRKTKAQRGK